MRRARLIVACSLWIATTAQASDPPEEPRPDADLEGVEEMVVWGVRGGRLDAIPAADTDVIWPGDFVGENKSLADLLSESEGVNVRRFGGAGDPSELSIRGSTPGQVVVTIDGVRANSTLTGGLDLSRICLPAIDRIEITRGAGSTLEGSGAIGGVVNLETRGPEAGPETRASFGAGDFGTFEGSVFRSASVGVVDYSVGYCGSTTDGDFKFARPVESIDGVEAQFDPEIVKRINNDRVQHGGTLRLDAPLGEGTLRFSDYAVYSSAGEPGTDSGNGPTAGQSTDAHSRDLSNLSQLRWTGSSPLGDGGELDAVVFNRFESLEFRDPSVVFRDPIDLDVKLSTTGAGVEDTWRAPVLGQSTETTFKIDFAHDALRRNDGSGRDRPQAGAAIVETLDILDDRLTLSAGARVDWTDGFDPQILPSFGIVITPLPWIRLRSQIGRAYRAPSFDELYHPDEGFIRGNPNLDPEDAWNFDAGIELNLRIAGPVSNLNVSATWFRREIDESIVWVLINPRTLAPINTGGATTQGYELAASLEVTRYIELSGNYTRTDSNRDSTGEAIPGQADDEISGRIRIGPADQWKLVGEVSHLGKILVNEGGSRVLPARTVWNASASVNIARIPWLPFPRVVNELWVYANVDNIGDEAVRDAISFPQPGRNVSAGFEVAW